MLILCSCLVKCFNKATEMITKFEPELLGISLGFDTLTLDPITFLKLTPECFSDVGKRLYDLGLNTLCIFEGGYSMEVGEALLNFLQGLGD